MNISITCISQGGATTKTIVLAAAETVLTSACDPQVSHGATLDTLRRDQQDPPRSPIGVVLGSDAPAGSFSAFGISSHHSPERIFFSSMPFGDPMMANSGTTIFSGVPVGTTHLLPGGRYVPRLTLANFSDKAIHASVQYITTAEATVGEEATLAGTNAQVSSSSLGTITVLPGRTQQMAFPDLTGNGNLQNSFIVRSDGPAGDLVAKLISTSDSSVAEVELLGKDLEDHDNGGNHPWTIEGETESTLLLFNNSAAAQYFNVEIGAGATVWRKAYKLQPLQTVAIRIKDLVDLATKDDKGNILPRDVLSGQIEWHMPAKSAGRGRLFVSDSSIGMARNFSCGYVAELCQVNYAGYTDFIIDGQSVSYGEMDPVCLYKYLFRYRSRPWRRRIFLRLVDRCEHHRECFRVLIGLQRRTLRRKSRLDLR